MCILTLLYTLPVVTWAQLLCWSSLLLRVFLIIADCDASIYNLFVVILHNVGCMKTSISWCAKHVARISVILMVLFWLKCFPVTCHPLQRLCIIMFIIIDLEYLLHCALDLGWILWKFIKHEISIMTDAEIAV